MKKAILAVAAAVVLTAPGEASARACGFTSDQFPAVYNLEAHGTTCAYARDVGATIQYRMKRGGSPPKTITTYPTASRRALRWACSYRTVSVPGEEGNLGRRFTCRRLSGVSVTGRLGS